MQIHQSINRIGIQANAADFDLYANGEYLTRVVDSTYLGAGRTGMFVQPFSTGGFKVANDELKIWVQEGGSQPTPPATPTCDPCDEDLFASTDSINVRAGPGNQFDSLGRIPKGTLFKVTGYSADGRWASAVFPPYTVSGGAGWVNTAYIQPAK